MSAPAADGLSKILACCARSTAIRSTFSHGPDYLAPQADCPVCVTVQDLTFRLHPAGMNIKSLFLFRMLAPKSIARAASTGVVFSDSASTLSDLRKLRWIGPEKGLVVPLACEGRFRDPVSEDEIEKLVEKFEIPRGYVLYVGPIEQRKNLGVLVHAYKLVGKVLMKRGLEVPPLVQIQGCRSHGRRLDPVDALQRRHSQRRE